MRLGVIADGMAARGNFADEIGTGASPTADQEKSGAGAVAFEQGEQLRRDGGIGAVVEGEGEGRRPRRAADRGTKELRRGGERRPSRGASAGGSDGGNCDGPGIHGFRGAAGN